MTNFSDSYEHARSQFRSAAERAGAVVETTGIHSDLAIDVAVWGKPGWPTLVVTSGLHGVEAFFGSAVQLALLERIQQSELPEGVRIVLVHGLNPYGFKHIRRFDQNNVDLNRNFLDFDEEHKGAPAGYEKLNAFLNPRSAPTKFDAYRLRAVVNILRYGVPALKEAIVSGQYRYPAGIFYGGDASAQATEFVKTQCDSWAGDSDVVAHIDLHTGLGKFATHKILVNEDPESTGYRWYTDTFGRDVVASLNGNDDTAYAVNGSMGSWLQHRFRNIDYYFAGAEFGTYGSIRVLGAIRAENQAQHYAKPHSAVYSAAKTELLECFCPKSELWRSRVVGDAMNIVTLTLEKLKKY